MICKLRTMILIKEQGGRTAALMVATIVPFAFFIGGIFNLILRALW